MKILMMGATGFLGSNIVKKLMKEKHEVTCVARAFSNKDILKDYHIKWIKNEINEIQEELLAGNYDWIINGICTYKQNDTLYGDILESNIIFPLQVFNAGLKAGVTHYMTMGTSLPEKTNLYSFSKCKYSEFGHFFCETENIDFYDLVLEMFYGGENEPDNRFISACKLKMKNNEDIYLTEGLQKRDLVRVEDIVNIVAKLVGGAYFSGYNTLDIGSGENHSIREIMCYMKEKCNSESKLLFGTVESRASEPNTCADVSWYEKIGYQLQYSYWEGLAEECIR